MRVFYKSADALQHCQASSSHCFFSISNPKGFADASAAKPSLDVWI